MQVYIEYVITDNLIINCLIIYLVSLLLRIKFRKLNILLAAMIGTLFAVAMPFISLNTYILFPIKLIVGVVMITVLKKFSLRQFFLTYICFVLLTFMLGGLCFGLMYLLKGTLSINGLIIYGFDVPMSVFILLIAAHVYLAVKLISVLKVERTKGKSLYKVLLTINGKTCSLYGFLDTGNMVYDSDNPVIILSYKSFSKICKEVTLDKLITKKVSGDDLRDAHYIPLSSATDTQDMLIFKINKMEIFNEDKRVVYNNVYTGLSYKNFDNFDCILHPDFFN